jgi:hypothetical protein
MMIQAMVAYGITTVLACQYATPWTAIEVGVGGMAALVPVIMLLSRAEERELLGEIKRREAAERARCRGEGPGQAY